MPKSKLDPTAGATYPTWVCAACGVSANVVTCLRRFAAPPRKLAFDVSTWHVGTCDFCKREQVEVTEPRDFFYPDFDDLWSVMASAARRTSN